MTTGKTGTFTLSESAETGTASKHFKTLRSLPRSWLIAAAVFYVASVLTVGLLAGLLPRRTQQITVLAAPTQSTPTTAAHISTTTGTSPSCVDDECKPRLASDLIVHGYQLEYMYNSTEQTTVAGQVTIEFTLKQPIRQLIYHAKEMVSLEEPALYEDGVYRLTSMQRYLPNDYISLQLPTGTLFPRNRYRLVQNFVASLTGAGMGFYQVFFKDANGQTGYVNSAGKPSGDSALV